MTTQVFLDILVQNIPPRQLEHVLQALSHAVHDNGQCPVCNTPDVAVDASSREITGDDVSNAAEWIERHEEDCLITLLGQTVAAQEG